MKTLRVLFVAILLCVLCAMPARAVIGDLSGVGVWDANCGCYSSWRVSLVQWTSTFTAEVFFSVQFPNGDYFITGPVTVVY